MHCQIINFSTEQLCVMPEKHIFRHASLRIFNNNNIIVEAQDSLHT